MRLVGLVCLAVVMHGASLAGQVSSPMPPPPQSARQALIEMFMGKGSDDFTKHLPDATRRALIHKGDTPESSFVLRFSTIAKEISSGGEHVETFDVGPNILVSEDAGHHQRIEVAVEHDSLLGEDDEIEISVHVYKDGEPQALPVLPRVTFTLRQEKEVWKLAEVTAAAHVPLMDEDYLSGLRKQQDESNEAAAQGRVSAIVMTETAYASNHPESGYTCSLASLFGTPQGEAAASNEAAPGGEEYKAYRFSLGGCDGPPATKYRLMAVPIDPESEMKTFCADQSGKVNFVASEKDSNCFSQGQTIDSGPQYSQMVE